MPLKKKKRQSSNTNTGASWGSKGYKEANKRKPESGGGNKDYEKELRWGGKTGLKNGQKARIVFAEAEPLSYHSHNMFDVGKVGFITCAGAENGCKLCRKKVATAFKCTWSLKVINDDDSIEAKFLTRGATDLRLIEELADSVAQRCSVCGKRMKNLGGTLKCIKHKDAEPSNLTEWVFYATRTGEGTSTAMVFDRDELIDDDLQEELDSVEGLDLMKICAPKSDKYIDKVIADINIDGEGNDKEDKEDFVDEEDDMEWE